MKRGQSILLAAIAVLSLICSVSQAAGSVKRKSTNGPDVRSNAVMVMDSSDSSIIFARHPDSVSPIASITKLMTALVVLDGKLPLDEVIVISKHDRSSVKGSYSRIPVGAKLTRGDLLHLALMSSENRAAHALARAYPGGMAAFVLTMNVKAKALGMTRTRFVDPSGLSAGNVASARDLTKLVIAAQRSTKIREYSTSRHHAVRIGRRMMEFRNTNSLVSNPAWDVAVQKTGYTSEAGHCLVMQAAIEERQVVIILLDSFGKNTRIADARRIRRWMEAQPGTRSIQAVSSLLSPQP